MLSCVLKVHDASGKDFQMAAQDLENSIEPVKIERLVAGGWGMAHQGALVTFVRGVLPGEAVTLKSYQSRNGYQFAKVHEILEPSPARIVPPCVIYDACGGCQLQHIDYPTQVSEKQACLVETLQRIGKVTQPSVNTPVGSQQTFQYRSWIRFKVSNWQGQLTLGFFQEKTHDFIPATECLLIPEPMRLLVQHIEKQFQSLDSSPSYVEELEVRHSILLDEYLIILKGKEEQVPSSKFLKIMATLPSVVGVIYSSRASSVQPHRGGLRKVEGRDYLYELFHGIQIRISDRSFMQGNWPVFEHIGQTILTWANVLPKQRILELYAGTGSVGLLLARSGAHVTFVEANPIALRDARRAASANHIGRCRFRPSKAESFLEETDVGEYDVVVIDPPRKGLTSPVLKDLLRLKVPRLFYLSCDAPSLARDSGQLVRGGYHLDRMQAFDMFPQTAHLEVLVELVME
jgi:23S rRNA (uracil1939-C5)-methyltransferase